VSFDQNNQYFEQDWYLLSINEACECWDSLVIKVKNVDFYYFIGKNMRILYYTINFVVHMSWSLMWLWPSHHARWGSLVTMYDMEPAGISGIKTGNMWKRIIPVKRSEWI
jgi:hypothetical protein